MTDPVEIAELLRSMQTDQTELRQLITRVMWHMRGSLSREEAWTLSPDERKDIIKLIEEHRDLTEKTGLPLL
jgi:hypothetical protein